ncbi:hypothetical protein B0H14DRAFT_3747439 [Mycena olivaceomarginata]|nr:hypothetical protein B0H14DRAFT_3747439 [Mycena olivaceomarginata]
MHYIFPLDAQLLARALHPHAAPLSRDGDLAASWYTPRTPQPCRQDLRMSRSWKTRNLYGEALRAHGQHVGAQLRQCLHRGGGAAPVSTARLDAGCWLTPDPISLADLPLKCAARREWGARARLRQRSASLDGGNIQGFYSGHARSPAEAPSAVHHRIASMSALVHSPPTSRTRLLPTTSDVALRVHIAGVLAVNCNLDLSAQHAPRHYAHPRRRSSASSNGSLSRRIRACSGGLIVRKRLYEASLIDPLCIFMFLLFTPPFPLLWNSRNLAHQDLRHLLLPYGCWATRLTTLMNADALHSIGAQPTPPGGHFLFWKRAISPSDGIVWQRLPVRSLNGGFIVRDSPRERPLPVQSAQYIIAHCSVLPASIPPPTSAHRLLGAA